MVVTWPAFPLVSWPVHAATGDAGVREDRQDTAAHSLPVKKPAVYDAVSDRARGWKRGAGESMEGPQRVSAIRRWDGAARACTVWDGLKKDAELWYRSGNVHVHLYGKGQSRRGPSFKLPLDALLEASCHALVDRFLDREPLHRLGIADEIDDLETWSRRYPGLRLDLYMAPPPGASRVESVQYHVAARNLLAWVFHKPLVGEDLGTALIVLLNSMQEIRCTGVENMADFTTFCKREGYLDLANQPIHALAMLRVGESFQTRDLFIHAFTHCAGMSNRLFPFPEYQMISSVTRKLIRRAKIDMDTRLGHAGSMIANFLQDDLSESRIGLTDGARLHMDRFRAFLVAYFRARLGSFPPMSTDPRRTIFEPRVYRIMREDFGALYEHLVDKTFTTSENSPPLAQGGICTLQTVHGFDLRNKTSPLPYPLPLLPEIAPQTPSRRLSWLKRSDKLRPDQRLVAHSALVKATNKSNADVLRNRLVIAYHKFEEDSLFSVSKADRHEKLSQVDARKIRWILVYAVFQVVRSCTHSPPECRDAGTGRYHTSIGPVDPPWKINTGRSAVEGKRATSLYRPVLSRLATPDPTTLPSAYTHGSSSLQITPAAYEIVPDIDYFALTHKKAVATTPSPQRKRGHSVSLHTSLRRSFTMLGTHTRSPSEPPTSSKTMSHHDLSSQACGNGSSDVHVQPAVCSANTAERSPYPGQLLRPLPSPVELLAELPAELLAELPVELPVEMSKSFPSCIPTASTSPPPHALSSRSPSNRSTCSAHSTAVSHRSTASTLSTAPSAPHTDHSLSPKSSSGAGSRGQRSMAVPAVLRRLSVPMPFSRHLAQPPALPRRNSRRQSMVAPRQTSAPVTALRTLKHSPSRHPLPTSTSACCHDLHESAVEDEVEQAPGAGLNPAAGVDMWAQFADVGGLTEVKGGKQKNGRRN